MHKYNPEIQRRRSMRLNGYDYSKAGLYFITICVKDRRCLLGRIEDGEMILNHSGAIANDYWMEIPKHYQQVALHEHILMPNHIHGIIEITTINNAEDGDGVVGTSHGMSLRYNAPDNIVWTRHGVSIPSHQRQFSKPQSGSVSIIMNQYKSSVKRWCNKNGHEYFQWQPRFYDHIIRSYDDYLRIARYIKDNPAKWHEDQLYSSICF